MYNKNIKVLNLLSKLSSGKGRKELNNLIKKIKLVGIKNTNTDIFYVYKQQSTNPEIIVLNSTNNSYNKLITEINEILENNIIQPQMLTDTKYYIPIYDCDFSYSGKIIKKSNLVHFFLSKNNSNKKLQILIQKGKNGFLADEFISSNGKKFYDV